MPQKIVKTISELVSIATAYPSRPLFRGEDRSDYEWLMPRLGREFRKLCADKGLRIEDNMELFNIFSTGIKNSFRALAHPFLDYSKALNLDPDEYLLILGQHYGLPTELLDWTWNPLVAAYFAVNANEKSDRRIWSYYASRDRISAGFLKGRLGFSVVKDIAVISPIHIDRRVTAQASVFTLHAEPLQDLSAQIKSDEVLEEFIIPHNSVSRLRRDLDTIGINTSTIIPALDGIARYCLEYARQLV